MKEIDTGVILHAARAAGFDGVRIVPCAEDGSKEKEAAPFQTKSILVLFSKYSPGERMTDGRIGVSAYYAASNRAYLAAGALAEKLCEMGVPALRDSALPARKIALLSGGCMGKNGFYYHPQFGSLIHIQTVRLGMEAQTDRMETQAACKHCNACVQACPTGAVTGAGLDVSKCLRSRMDGTLPEEMKPYIYQLLGCEKCQTACPMNKAEGAVPNDFDLAEAIRGDSMGELKTLVGKNMARRVRITNQAITVAANRRNKTVLPEVTALAGDERFADACRYYLERTGQTAPKKY